MTEEREIISCALTGHRVLDEKFNKKYLQIILNQLIQRKNVSVFYCGMAVGFDMEVCEMLVEMKKDFPQIKIIACIPCPKQSDTFKKENKKKYDRLLQECWQKEVVCEKYYPGCMLERNRYMVDRADYLLAYCVKDTGGTAYTVKYAEKKGMEVFFV